jgi:hypothetical protein
MKRLSSFLLVLSTWIIVVTSCSTKCDDFDNKIVDWMPYKTNDKIIISQNDNNDTLTVNLSEIYHTDKIDFGLDCACEDAYILNLSTDSLIIEVRFNDSKLIKNSSIIVNDEYMDYYEQLETLTINEKVFTDLIIYMNTNNGSSMRYEKIVIAKNIGIIAIFGENDEWVIVDESKKAIDASEIEFKSTDC